METNPVDLRKNVFKFFRYLLLNQSVGQLYNKVGLPLFMCKSLEKMCRPAGYTLSEKNYKHYQDEMV